MLYQNTNPGAFTEGVFIFVGGQTDLTEDRFQGLSHSIIESILHLSQLLCVLQSDNHQ